MIGNSWDLYLKEEYNKDYFKSIINSVNNEYKNNICYPPKNEIFNAFRLTPYENVKVVIIGQDPYHGEHQAEGLSFSVKNDVNRPPSLQNIYKELQTDCNCYIPNNGYLVKWAEQGVLLLNTVLTVRRGAANSHKGKGWEKFTDAVIRAVNEQDRPVVYLLWGANARSKKALVTNPKHLVLETVHPSPLSAYNGFFGCGHFKLANEYLEKNGIAPIDWKIDDI
jgi:uracil-DNA glycosylase